jgi:DNA-binding PadR family transcriptional regulator
MYPHTNPGRSEHRHHHPTDQPFAGSRRHHRHGPFGGPGPFGGQFEEHGPRGRHGHPGRRPGRGRAQRGDVRTAALLLLAEQPMHGYQLMQAIAERTAGAWQPSPGAIYPTLNQLQDEGLIAMESEGGRKLATLTEAGRTYVDEQGETMADPFVEFSGGGGDRTDLRHGIEDIATACRQIGRGGSEAQLAAAQKVLTETKRSLYLILAEDPGALGTEETRSEN